MTDTKEKGGVEGEGSYSGTKAYDDATAKFVKDGKVEKAARDAKKAMSSSEATDLKAAEAKGRAGDPRGQNKH